MSAHAFPYEQIIAFASGDLDEARSAMVSAHAKTCEQCARTIDRYKRIRATVCGDDSLLPPLSTLARAQKILVSSAPRAPRRQWEILWRAIRLDPRLPLVVGVIALILTNLLLLSSMGALTAATQASLPGDILYPTKMAFEAIQLTLSFKSTGQAQRHLEFAHNRVDEIQALAGMGREIEIPAVVRSLQSLLDQLSLTIDAVDKQDPGAARDLEQNAVDALGQYVTTLTALKGTGLVSVSSMVEPAIKACETKKSYFKKLKDHQVSPRPSPTHTSPKVRTPTPAPSGSPAGANKTPVSTNALPEPSRYPDQVAAWRTGSFQRIVRPGTCSDRCRSILLELEASNQAF